MGKEAYTLGLTSSHSPSVAAACVCFLELLGLSSLKLRVDMKVVNVILGYKCRNEDAHPSSVRESLGTAPLFRFAQRTLGKGRDSTYPLSCTVHIVYFTFLDAILMGFK